MSCWTNFQVDEAEVASRTEVACPKCQTLQPTTPSAVASAVIGAEDTIVDDEMSSAALREMLQDIPPQPPVGQDTWPHETSDPGSGGHGWAMGAPKPGGSQSSSQVGTLDRFMGLPSATQDPTPPAPSSPSKTEELGWRIKLSSGLVLSFPTIAMVTTWAKEKDADSVEISYGHEDFQPYAVFQTRFQQIRNPVDAFFARKSSTTPGMVAAPLPSAASPEQLGPVEQDFDAFADAPPDEEGEVVDEINGLADDYRPNPEAVAAAAALERPFKSDVGYGQTITFRTDDASQRGSSGMLLLLTLLVLGGVVGVLFWQGIF